MPPMDVLRRWWGAGRTPEQSKAFNDMCRSHFGTVLSQMENLPARQQSSAIAAELQACNEAPAGSQQAYSNILALILLLDQMPRCILGASSPLVYRQYDPIAQALSLSAIKQGADAWHNADSLAWRFWFYLPLEHSEDKHQHQMVAELFDQIKDQKDEPYYNYAGKAAREHREIIEQFGRYPYRNECLERQTTAQEAKWLQDNGNPFATK